MLCTLLVGCVASGQLVQPCANERFIDVSEVAHTVFSLIALVGFGLLLVLTPIVLNQIPGWFGISMSTALLSHIEFMVFGGLIALARGGALGACTAEETLTDASPCAPIHRSPAART